MNGEWADDRSEELIAMLSEMHERIARMEGNLDVIKQQLGEQATRKEWYTTHELAELLQKRPYTVREWCRLGRIHAEKTHCGRGIDEEWRISFEEVERYRNEGLLPVPRRY